MDLETVSIKNESTRRITIRRSMSSSTLRLLRRHLRLRLQRTRHPQEVIKHLPTPATLQSRLYSAVMKLPRPQ
jgi:hypothetical protein